MATNGHMGEMDGWVKIHTPHLGCQALKQIIKNKTKLHSSHVQTIYKLCLFFDC